MLQKIYFATNTTSNSIEYVIIPNGSTSNILITNWSFNNAINIIDIEYILGSTDNLFIGVVTNNDSIFNKTIINITNGVNVNIFDENRYSVIISKQYCNTIKYGNTIFSTDGINLSITKFSNIGSVVSTKISNLGLIRNTGKVITDIDVDGSDLVVLFDDNTVNYYDINVIIDLNNDNVSMYHSVNRLEFRINSKLIKITNGINLKIFFYK